MSALIVKYTFVIPTFNNKENLANSLEALARLEYARSAFEVIVVDDGSADGVISSLSFFRDRLNLHSIRLERDKWSCRSRARNAGWKSASGERVVFIDSDIIVKPDYLRQLDRYFTSDDGSMVIGTRMHTSAKVQQSEVADGSIFTSARFMATNISSLDYRNLVFSSQSYNGRVIPDPWLHAYSCNLAISKRWLVASSGFNENFIDWGLEDVEFAYRLYRLGIRIDINPFLEVIHQSAMQRDDLAISSQRISGYRRNVQYFMSLHPDALYHYPDPVAVLVSGHQYRDFVAEDSDYCVENFKENCPDDFVSKLVDVTNAATGRIVLFDYADESSLDVQVQKTRTASIPILYFPMSRKINVEALMRHVNLMRARETENA